MNIDEALAHVDRRRQLDVLITSTDAERVLAAEVRELRTYEETAPVLAKMIDEIKEALGAPIDATHAEVLARIELLSGPRATEGEP